MTDLFKKASGIADRLSDCRGIVESSNLSTDLCKRVTDCIAESSAFAPIAIERLEHEIDVQCSSEYVEKILKSQEALSRALQTLAWQHGWGKRTGKCVCAAHRKVEELGLRYDVPAKEDNDG